MNRQRFTHLAREGLWDNNIAMAQLLALCPLLAVTNTATNGLGLGLATLVVLFFSNLIIALLRDIITQEVRIAVFVLLIAGIVTLVDMMMNAWLHDLHKVLGLFIPLIVSNCAILGRAESFASRQPITDSMLDGLFMGLGFIAALVTLGGVREILGQGTLFANAALMFGEGVHFIELTLIPDYRGFLLMALPPGGFLVMGFLLAGKRLIDARKQRQVAIPLQTQEASA